MEAWADRTVKLLALDGIKQVFLFENRGRELRVLLQHPHGQIFGYPYVTPRTVQLLPRAGAHWQRTGDLMNDVLASEPKSSMQVVIDTEQWTAFVPAAACRTLRRCLTRSGPSWPLSTATCSASWGATSGPVGRAHPTSPHGTSRPSTQGAT
jgi:hypothetical protein